MTQHHAMTLAETMFSLETHTDTREVTTARQAWGSGPSDRVSYNAGFWGLGAGGGYMVYRASDLEVQGVGVLCTYKI